MARMNTKTNVPSTPVFTHNGARSVAPGNEEALCRSVMACMLWEKTFYENGEDIATRIARLAKTVSPEFVASLAIEARDKMQIRHVPLFLTRVLAERRATDRTMRDEKFGTLVSDTLTEVIKRPDEITEFLALYWKDNKGGKKTLSNAVKRGLAGAFSKFSEYQFAKWNKDKDIKLRDALFLTHAKPDGGTDHKNKAWRKEFPYLNSSQYLNDRENLYQKIVEDKLETPDTWEVALSAGADKKATFERLIREKKLGGMATLMNLRNMIQAGVDENLIRERLLSGCGRALPFRFITAARYAPIFEAELEQAMFKSAEDIEKLKGSTGLLVDVSGSMDWGLSAGANYAKTGETTRIDVANGLAILLAEKAERFKVATFSERVAFLPNRRGFALRDSIQNSQGHGGTYLGRAIERCKAEWGNSIDRLVVLTDEQSNDRVGNPFTKLAYIVNIAPYQNGVGYDTGWTHINGWSERIFDYIQFSESLERKN